MGRAGKRCSEAQIIAILKLTSPRSGPTRGHIAGTSLSQNLGSPRVTHLPYRCRSYVGRGGSAGCAGDLLHDSGAFRQRRIARMRSDAIPAWLAFDVTIRQSVVGGCSCNASWPRVILQRDVD
jgi:hypothetical protein